MKNVLSHSSLVLGSLRERATIVLVGALCGAYATVLLIGAASLVSMAQEGQGALSDMLGALASVFVALSLYVGSLVIAGCTATVIAGREGQIATLRLLGAEARALRRTVSFGCAQAAGVGAIAGVALGHVIAWVGRAELEKRGVFPHTRYPMSDWRIIVAVGAVALCGLVAGRVGARRVLSVNPASAMTGATHHERTTARRGRAAIASVCLTGGALAMALSCWLGEHDSSAGFMCAFVGCAAFASGVLVGSPFIVPRAVALFGRVLGNAPSARIARRNAVVDPMRTSRSTLGLIVGSGLIVTILSGTEAVRASIPRWGLDAKDDRTAHQVLDAMATLMSCIVAISSVIAAVGFVSTMSLIVIQRRRELGLLRAMGLTARDVTRMVTKESLALGVTAVLLGMCLGILFGSVAAESLLGGMTDGFVWGVPTTALGIIGLCGLALVLIAALPPARRATQVTPVEALRTA